MKFSKVVAWFLSCVVLLLGAISAAAVTTVRGTKSNGSAKATVCRDLACCKANPKAMASNGQPCSAILAKNSGHASEKTTTTNGSKSNSFKEGAPGTPIPTPGPVGATTINNSKSNSFKEAAPTAVTNTPVPVGAVKFGRDKLKGATKVVVAPTPTPTPAAKKQQQKAQR
jgi:hypothetical protein